MWGAPEGKMKLPVAWPGHSEELGLGPLHIGKGVLGRPGAQPVKRLPWAQVMISGPGIESHKGLPAQGGSASPSASALACALPK